jgi:hypothetical protein
MNDVHGVVLFSTSQLFDSRISSSIIREIAASSIFPRLSFLPSHHSVSHRTASPLNVYSNLKGFGNYICRNFTIFMSSLSRQYFPILIPGFFTTADGYDDKPGSSCLPMPLSSMFIGVLCQIQRILEVQLRSMVRPSRRQQTKNCYILIASLIRSFDEKELLARVFTFAYTRPMKQCILFSVFISVLAYAGEKDSLDNHFQATIQHQSLRLNLLYDPDLTMRVGAEDILTVQYGITREEDKLLGTSWFPERSVLAKTGGILLRAAKYAFLDLPADDFLYLFQHECFGHGGQMRELGFNEIRYHFDPPLPYGKGSASTRANLNASSPSLPEYLSIYEGGMESQALLNRSLALRCMATSEINYRDAALYFVSLSGNIGYIQSTGSELSKPGSDPELYLKALNAQFGFTDIKNLRMTVASFKSKMKLSYANPFYYFSIYYFLKTFLWDGKSASGFPTLHFRRVRYLPVLRSGLTPFGPEYHLENYLRFGETTSLIDVRIGDRTFCGSWGGIGASFFNIVAWRRYFTDLDISIWNQPKLLLGEAPGTPKGGGLGGAFSIRGYYDFPNSLNSFSAVIELGYKSVGFLEGYPLDASPIFTIGIGYRL